MENSQTNNVVSLFAQKPKDTVEENQGDEVTELSFTEVMVRNKQNADRLRKERNTANKSVLRSYRIKNQD